MSEERARTTAEMMDKNRPNGSNSRRRLDPPTFDQEYQLPPEPAPALRDHARGPATALIDADASLGHPVSVHAMNLAVDKCLSSGVAVVSVFNFHHFGAADCYAKIAADRGMIGMVTAGHPGRDDGSTFGAEPIMGTDPIARRAGAAASVLLAGHRHDHGRRGQGQGAQADHKPLPPRMGRRR